MVLMNNNGSTNNWYINEIKVHESSDVLKCIFKKEIQILGRNVDFLLVEEMWTSHGDW